KVLTVWRSVGEDQGIDFLRKRAHDEKEVSVCDPISSVCYSALRLRRSWGRFWCTGDFGAQGVLFHAIIEGGACNVVRRVILHGAVGFRLGLERSRSEQHRTETQ